MYSVVSVNPGKAALVWNIREASRRKERLCSVTRRRGGVGQVKRDRTTFQAEGPARERLSMDSSGSREAASEEEADRKRGRGGQVSQGPRAHGEGRQLHPSQRGALTRQEAGKQLDLVGVCPRITLAAVLKRDHLTGPTGSTKSKLENGRESVHPRTLSPSGYVSFPSSVIEV